MDALDLSRTGILESSSPDFFQFVPWVIGFGIFVVMGVGVVLLLRAIVLRKSHLRGGDDTMVTLLLTVPRFHNEEDTKQTDNVTMIKEQIAVAETVYAAIGGLKPHHGFLAWFLGRHDAVALEIVAHKKLITFYVTVSRSMREFLEQQIHAQWSDAQFEEVPDYNMFAPQGTVLGGYVTLKRRSVFPVKTYKDLESDPLNALTNVLSKVAEHDGVAIQYLIRPTHHGWREAGAKIARHMQEGMTLEEAQHGKSWMSVLSTGKEGKEKQEQRRRDRKMSPAETKMVEGIENKISKAGVEVNIRIVAQSSSPDIAQSYLNNVLSAFNQFSIYEFGNSFMKAIPRKKTALIHDFVYRRFAPRYSIILNTEEMASVWHLPLSSTETPNIRWMMARTAPAPTTMGAEGLRIGTNTYRGKETVAYLKTEDRRRHMYIVGKTGSGKSEFIKNLAAQDIRDGKGVCVIDPHGDLADGLLELIPKERIDDVIYFNPSDMEKPMGLNMLEAPSLEMRDFAVQEMISIFYMLFPPEMIGPMFEHNMRNYMLTLMADINNPGTIVEIPRMISDDAFQKKWVSKVTDPVVKSFWQDEMAKTSDYHKSEMMGYLVSKVGRFVENEMMRNIIGQSKSSFNFRDIMDNQKILLVNLSKGKTGEVNANLIGLVLVAKLQMAAFTRADMPEKDRKDFYLYIDEFQNFITPSIATILSEARKYRLNLVMAHQYMGQLVKDGKTEIRDAVLGNVGSYFVARVGPDDTEVLGKIFEPTFAPYDLMNTSFLMWSAKIIIDGAQTKPFTLMADPMVKGTKEMGEGLKQISRLMYGRDREDVAAEIAERAGIGAKKDITLPDPPMGL